MIQTPNPAGKPGIQTYILGVTIDPIWQGREKCEWMAAPATIDGTLSYNSENSPYTFALFAGTIFGRVTSTKKLANSILGLSTGATLSGATTIQTTAFVAAAIVNRIGATGTFYLTGPATAGGAYNQDTITYSNANTTTGVITVTATTHAFVSGSMIQPTDGSQTALTVLCDINGISVADQTNVNRIDVECPRLLLRNGTLNDQGALRFWPTDPTLQNLLKAQLKAFNGSLNFLSDETG